MRLSTFAAALLLSVASPAMADWSEARTDHFIIYSEQKPAELKLYAERLERFDALVRFMRKMDDPPLTDGGKVTIYILPNVVSVRNLYSGGRSTSGGVLGFYSPRASGSVAFFSSKADRDSRGPTAITPEQVFQHEYMHHLMLSNWKTAISPWLVEGMAEFFGTIEFNKDWSAKVGLAPQSRSYGVTEDIGFNVEELLTSKPPKDALERESVYGKGWVLTHMLAFDPARTGQLDKYLRALERGDKPIDAARGAFGDLKALDKSLDKYARSNFRGLALSPGPEPKISIRPLSAGDAAIMNVRIRSERGVDKKLAAAVVEDARRIAAAHTPSAFVHGTLAEAEYDVKNYAGAIAAVDKALALDPNNVQAMVYRARAMTALAKKEPAKANWAEIRRLLIKANRADTENAEPLWLFHQTFEDAGETPTKAAKDGLLYALALAPQDRSLRLSAVRQLLRDDRVEDATALFGILANDPHLPIAQQASATTTLDKMRAGDGKGALAAIDEEMKKQQKKAEEAEGA